MRDRRRRTDERGRGMHHRERPRPGPRWQRDLQGFEPAVQRAFGREAVTNIGRERAAASFAMEQLNQQEIGKIFKTKASRGKSKK